MNGVRPQMIDPSHIEYHPFSDQQIEAFAAAAGIEYENPDLSWRTELDAAARDLLFDYAAKSWPTPSEMLKELRRIEKAPGEFLERLATDDHLRNQPVVTAILHGTRWHPDRLLEAITLRGEFLAGVKVEIEHLTRVIGQRKSMRMGGNGGHPAMGTFIERLALVFKDAFWCDVNKVTVPYDGGKPRGPFIGFSKAVAMALAANLPDAMKPGELHSVLRGMSQDTSSAIWNRLARSEAYRLGRELGKVGK